MVKGGDPSHRLPGGVLSYQANLHGLTVGYRGPTLPLLQLARTTMTVHEAIAALNDVSTEKIKTLTTRDGREVANLPRVGREVIIGDSQFNKNVKVTAAVKKRAWRWLRRRRSSTQRSIH